jgi:hypothetical protein
VPLISHQTDEQLELYALGRLDEPGQAVVEEHLLVCVTCQQRLDEVEAFAMAMHQAIASGPAQELEKTGWLAWFRAWLWPWPAAVAGFAALMLTIILSVHPGRNLAPLASLQLTAIRGDVPAVAPARETDITLTDAPAGTALRVEVVDATGGKVADSLRITKSLAEGSYFVRLYDSSGKLLHEYGFRVL